MRKLALTALFVGALGFAACGGDDGDDAGGIGGSGTDTATATGTGTGTDTDTSPGPDTGEVGVCNPMEQTGCDAGEKCAQELDTQNEGQDNERSFFRTSCVAEGTVAGGAACSRAANGVDDCVAGSECFGGSCLATCTNPSDVCINDANCNSYSNVYTEFEGTLGICEPLCDPFAHETLANGVASGNACPGREATDDAPALVGMCVGDIGHPTGAGSCGLETEGNAGNKQNSPCQSPDDTICFASGCAKGYTTGSWGENPFAAGERNWCLGMCNPLDSHDAQVASNNGEFGDESLNHCNPNGTTGNSLTNLANSRSFPEQVTENNVPVYGCRYRWVGDGMGGIDSSTTMGLCYPVVAEGIGAHCGGVNLTAYIEGWFTEEGTGCLDNEDDPETFSIEKCPLGCVSIETVEAELEASMPAARVKRNAQGQIMMRQDLLERFYPENAKAMDYPVSSL